MLFRSLGERERLVENLGQHNALILRNHGLITCGPSAAEAFNLLYQLEMSCRAQVDLMAAGASINMPSPEVIERTSSIFQPGKIRSYGILEWPAMLRRLEAEQRSNGYPQYDQ